MINTSIDGHTKVFGVIGNPISHTFSPHIQNTFAVRFNQNISYTAFHVLENNLETAVKGAYSLGILGLNVTIPHKREVIKYLSDVDKKAFQIGAVNTLKYTKEGYKGYNTDIIGMYYSLKNKSIEISKSTVLILGAGGSACAACIMAASEGAEKIIIANRTLENAEMLKENVNKYYNMEVQAIKIEDIINIESCDIIINTTTLGFGNNKGISPIGDTEFFELKKPKVAFDVIYTPWETQFLKDANKYGLICINGFDMLVYQAVAAQEIWFNDTYNKNEVEKIKNELSEFYLKTYGS